MGHGKRRRKGHATSILSSTLLVLASGIVLGLAVAMASESDDASATSSPLISSREPSPKTLTGTVQVPVTDEALYPRVGARPGQSYDTMTLRQLDGLLNLTDRLLNGEEMPCARGVGGGFEDLRRGTRVVVSDTGGDVLAKALLTGGDLTYDYCTFEFAVALPPSASDWYQVEVGQRDAAAYSRYELDDVDWAVVIPPELLAADAPDPRDPRRRRSVGFGQE